MGTDYYAKLVCGVRCRWYLVDRMDDNYQVPVTVDDGRARVPVYDKNGKAMFRTCPRRVFNFTRNTSLSTEDFFHIYDKADQLETEYGIQIITAACENWIREDDAIGIHLNDHYVNKEGDLDLYNLTQKIIHCGITRDNFQEVLDFTSKRLHKIGIMEVPQVFSILHISY